MIYFIYDELSNAVKIGKTGDNTVYHRLSMLQVGNPRELKLLGVMEGGVKEEKELHIKFETYWIRGEWFKYINEVKEYILTNIQTYKQDVKTTTFYNKEYRREYDKVKDKEHKEKLLISLNKYFTKADNSIITISDVKDYLIKHNIKGLSSKTRGTLSVTKIAEYFNCQIKTVRAGTDKKPTRCIVGLAFLY